MVYIHPKTNLFKFNNIKPKITVVKVLIQYIKLCRFYDFFLFKDINCRTGCCNRVVSARFNFYKNYCILLFRYYIYFTKS